MKKLLSVFVFLFALQTLAWGDNDKPVPVEQLPQNARQFIRQYFADTPVAIAKMENELFDKTYDVIFTNGNKVEFDKKGNWKKIDCEYSEVPKEVIPAAISKYVKANYPDTKILKLEKDRKDYEIKLSNGWEVKFDLKFNVIDLDR